MAYTNKAMYRGTLGSSSATLYTAPSGTTGVLLNAVLANKTGSAVTVTLSLDGILLFPTVSVGANTVVSLDLRQTLDAGKTASGFASSGSAIDCHLSGIEVS